MRLLPPLPPPAAEPAAPEFDAEPDVLDIGAARAARDRAKLDQRVITITVAELNQLGREYAAERVAVAVAAERARLIELFKTMQLIINQQGKTNDA